MDSLIKAMDSFIKALKVEQGTASWWDKFSLWFYERKLSLPYYYRWHDFYWKMRSYVIPQHRELTKVVGREWRDLPGIIEDFLCECVISYVEKEKGFETVVWEGEEEKELKDLYDFAKWRRHEMALAFSQALDEWYKASNWNRGDKWEHINDSQSEDQQQLFKVLGDMELEHEKIMTDYLIRIVKIRQRLWI